MVQTLILQLKAFLAQDPGNNSLRFLLADHLLEAGRLEEAENEFKQVQKSSENLLAEAGLARILFVKKAYLASAGLLKQIMGKGLINVNILSLYARCLLKENLMQEATSVYLQIIQENPKYEDPELDLLLNIKSPLSVQTPWHLPFRD